MAMTGPAFNTARKSGIIGFEPDIDAMQTIALTVEEATSTSPLPPIVLFTRYGGPGYSLLGQHDEKWPLSLEQARSAAFFSASDIAKEERGSGTVHDVIEYAKAIGAPMIAEMTVFDWHKPLAIPFAKALLFEHRSAELPKRTPSFLGRVASDVRGAFGDNAHKQGIANTIARLDPPLPEPFIIKRRPQLPL